MLCLCRIVIYVYFGGNEITLDMCGFRRYDPKTDEWTTMTPLGVPRDAVGICLLGDRLYAVGGYDGQSYLNSVESYDAQANEWREVTSATFITNLPNYRHAHHCPSCQLISIYGATCAVIFFSIYMLTEPSTVCRPIHI